MKEAGFLEDKDEIFNYKLHNFMAVYLLTEIYRKRADPNYVSRSEKYINILPEDVLDFPVCYDEKTLAELEGSELLKTIRRRKSEYEEEYEMLCEKIPDFK